MIYAILGKSSSGKTTITKELVKRGLGNQIITTTTRPIRKKEENENDYFFTCERMFGMMKEQDKLISIFVSENGWKYGINTDQLQSKEDLFVVIEPSGYDQLIDYIGKENITSILIESLYSTRMVRSIKRGDSFEEVLRRAHSDDQDFEGINEKVDYIILNSFDYERSLDHIIDEIQITIGK
ncbi:hypothetical protein [Staphylococcus equorum]|uniref:Guanylate kinase-like domain-containing protein n=1 Tax=Staphylococcus equorum TaxID=246432 RepID=A0A9X4R2W9_9STAP|nr:hypothetical protein [Staphylococcus equorum]MDG0860354.1 hypothetical protein [Staphylococcus equorum]